MTEIKGGISIPTNLAFWVLAALAIAFVLLLVLKSPVLSNLFKWLPGIVGSLPFS